MKKQTKVVKNKHSNSYDVVVVGGGTAGVIAAVQSARAGVRTLLIEKTEILGGTITSARVFSPGLFHAWGKQIIRGIGWELVERCVRENGDAELAVDILPHRVGGTDRHDGAAVEADRAVRVDREVAAR